MELNKDTIIRLESLRSKLTSLQETFNTHLLYLNDPHFAFTWPDLVNKFNTLTAKFASLSEDFYGYTLLQTASDPKRLNLHPQKPPTSEHDATVLSVLLRTKLIPEIEKEEASIRQAVEQELGKSQTSKSTSSSFEDTTALAKELEHWQTLRKDHDALAHYASEYVSNLVDANKSLLFTRVQDAPQAKAEGIWQSQGFKSEDTWNQWRLESMLCYASSGRTSMPDSDFKTAQAART